MHSSRSSQEDLTEVFDELTCTAIAAQGCPPLSKQRQEALDKLFDEVQRQGRLWRPDKNTINEDNYNDAVQELWLYVCQSIEKYDPQRSAFMGWVNMLLRKRFYNLACSKNQGKYESIFFSIDELKKLTDSFLLNQQKTSLMEEVEECINSDIEGVCKREHIKNRPQISFQILAQRRLAGDSWRDISVDVGISATYLNKIFQRSLKKLAPYIKTYVQQ